ncbi:hypothetical protein FRC01_013511, partial [Tulasnella sp. 417]
MSQRMNFFALQKQSSLSIASATSSSTNADPPSVPSEPAKRPASGSIPSLNLAMIKHHHKNSSSNGQPRNAVAVPAESSDAHANNSSSSSSSSLLLGINGSPSLSETITSDGSREECQPPTHLPTSRSAAATDSSASTIEPDNSATLNPERASKPLSLRRQNSSTRRALGPGLINIDAIVNNNAAAARSSSKTDTATSKPLSALSNILFSQRRNSQSHTLTDKPDAARESDERRTPPPRQQYQSRKAPVRSSASISRVRSRSSCEMDDEIQMGNNQDLEEPALKRVKGEPVDDDIAHSTYSSPSINRPSNYISTCQPSNEVIDVDSTEMVEGLGPQNAASPPNFQPQPSSRPQRGAGEEQFSLIESINDDFESYLEQQHQKTATLRKKWLTCSMEEWEQGGSEICNKFGAVIERVRDGMKSKIRAFSGINARMADHSNALDQRETSLQQEKELLVKETGR